MGGVGYCIVDCGEDSSEGGPAWWFCADCCSLFCIHVCHLISRNVCVSWYPLNADAPAAEIKHTFELVDHRTVAKNCLAEALAVSGDDNMSGWGLVLDTPAGGADHCS